MRTDGFRELQQLLNGALGASSTAVAGRDREDPKMLVRPDIGAVRKLCDTQGRIVTGEASTRSFCLEFEPVQVCFLPGPAGCGAETEIEVITVWDHSVLTLRVPFRGNAG